MRTFSKESLEALRQRIDLVDLLSAHLDLKRSGASYKTTCPFHDEKTPSFIVQKGDSHYHCFGCGAHGDAIQFMMTHLRMGFADAVEALAERFQVPLVHVDDHEKKGPSKTLLKEALDQACRLYHFLLLHTPEGHIPLQYLYARGLSLEFIQAFQIGWAPVHSGMLRRLLHSKQISDEIMEEAGLLQLSRGERERRDFFSDRITFPIRDAAGAVIGFSARKYKEETFGGKYINTPETPLFKKSKVLFGLNYCRKRIAKEQKVIIVEGQIDALRLIHAGFNITVAGQGTAFGEGHVKELLALGVSQAYLALDGDAAGQEAARKIGHLFQKEGVEVKVVKLPAGSDPDSFLRKQGAEQFEKLLDSSEEYLQFLVELSSRSHNISSPAGKNALIQEIAQQIHSWDKPVMVHESLRKLAQLTQTPEEMVATNQSYAPNVYIKKGGTAGLQTIDPDRILESDFLTWLLLLGKEFPQLVQIAQLNVKPDLLRLLECRDVYQTYLHCYSQKLPLDLLSLSIAVEHASSQILLQEIMQRKVNRSKAEQLFVESTQRLLDRNWMEQRETVKMKIQSGQYSEEAVLELVKQFDMLKRSPAVIGISS